MNTFKSKKIYPTNYSRQSVKRVNFFQNRRHVFVFSQSNNNTCITVLYPLQLRNQMLGCIIQQRVAIVCFTEAPNDGFPLNTFKTLFRLSRILLDLQKCILSGFVEFVSDWSSQGNLSLFEITRASVLFSQKFWMQIKDLRRREFF